MKNKIFAIMLLITLSLFSLISVASALKVELTIEGAKKTDDTYILTANKEYNFICSFTEGDPGKTYKVEIYPYGKGSWEKVADFFGVGFYTYHKSSTGSYTLKHKYTYATEFQPVCEVSISKVFGILLLWQSVKQTSIRVRIESEETQQKRGDNTQPNTQPKAGVDGAATATTPLGNEQKSGSAGATGSTKPTGGGETTTTEQKPAETAQQEQCEKEAGRKCKEGCDAIIEEEKKGLTCESEGEGGKALVCCERKTCNQLGGIKVLKSEEKDKCRQPTKLIFGARDLGENEICCEGKEKIREAVKKPGRLGRLASCYGKYWLWGKENALKYIDEAWKALEEAWKALEEANKSVNLQLDGVKNLFSQIKNEKDHMKRAELIDKLDKELDKMQVEIAKTEPTEEVTQEKLQNAYSNIDKARDKLEKAREVHAMTWSEGLFNMIACASGGIKAGVLSFQGDDAEMGHCSAEQPLKGNELCRKCNEDPYRICTRERCEILGDCIAVPTAKGDQYNCIAGKCEDLGLPLFTYVNASWFIDGELNGTTIWRQSDGKELNIALNNDKPIPFNTKMIMINLTTNKPAQCRYVLDKPNASFSEMQDFEDNYFPILPDGRAASQYAYVLLPGDITRDERIVHKIFIKCKNACGVEPKASYDQNVIKFKLARKPDQLPPIIIHVDPASNSVVRGDLAFVNASFWLDEQGSCKFSDKSNNFTINYSAMIKFGRYDHENSSIVDGGCYAGKCLDRNETCSRCWLLLNMSRGYDMVNYSYPEFNETKLYYFIVRCSDSAGNVMKEDDIFEYSLMTAPGYNISIIRPAENEKTYERQPEIEVTSEPRATECRYRIFEYARERAPRCEAINWTDMWPIDAETATTHKGKHNETLNASTTGLKHLLCVKCRDFWGIEVASKIDFFVLLDPLSPEVIRMYHDTTINDLLVIETNEEAECVYTHKGCNYNFTEGNAMMSTDKLLHAAHWQLSPYYVKCKDKWDNYPGGKPDANVCTIVIYPYEIPQFG
ncbi:MAG: hypothetical protein QXE93_01985 [Candidatus Pacearchaeota archaeon]